MAFRTGILMTEMHLPLQAGDELDEDLAGDLQRVRLHSQPAAGAGTVGEALFLTLIGQPGAAPRFAWQHASACNKAMADCLGATHCTCSVS